MPTDSSFLARYLAGERKAVTDELIALGDAVRSGPLLDDAQSVAREIIRRARQNIETLHFRLVGLGYQFEEPNAAFVVAGPEAEGKIAEVEQRLGRLPLLARAWYESIASADFSQSLDQMRGPTGPDVNGLGSHAALVMHSIDRCWMTWDRMCSEADEHFQLMERIKVENPEQYKNFPDGPKVKPTPPRFLPTGGTASNCDSKGFELPCNNFDDVMYYDDGGVYLVDELRDWFKWGGFPYCKFYLAGHKMLPWDARPNAEKIIPLLREGLLEV